MFSKSLLYDQCGVKVSRKASVNKMDPNKSSHFFCGHKSSHYYRLKLFFDAILTETINLHIQKKLKFLGFFRHIIIRLKREIDHNTLSFRVGTSVLLAKREIKH